MPRQATSGKRLSVWTGLPASPLDGQEILYRWAQTVLPADPSVRLWHLRRDAAANLWLPIGAQEPVEALDTVQRTQQFGGGNGSQFSAQGLVAYAPLPGTYRVEAGAGQALVSSGLDNLFQQIYNTGWVTIGSIGSGASSTWSTMHGATRMALTVANGLSITWGCALGSTTQTVNCSYRYVRLYPVSINP